MGDVVHLPILPMSRDQVRSRRKREVRNKTVSMTRMPKHVLNLDGAIADLMLDGVDVQRPRTRGDCVGGERPCPWISCEHHLYLDVREATGAVLLNFPDIAPDQLELMPATCSLDVADEGGSTLERVGELLNVTRERIRQLEVRARNRMDRRAKLMLADFRDHVVETRETIVDHGDGGTSEGHVDHAKDAEGLARGVWDLSQAETPNRLTTAQIQVHDAYETALAARGLITVQRHELADERVGEAERVIAARAAEKEEEDMGARLSLEEHSQRNEQILAFLKEHGPSSPLAIAEGIGVNSASMGRTCRELVEAGVLRERGERRGKRYFLPGDEGRAEVSGGRGSKPKPRAKPAPAKKPLTLGDVAKKHTGGFTITLGALPVECSTAEEVVALARAWSASA